MFIDMWKRLSYNAKYSAFMSFFIVYAREANLGFFYGQGLRDVTPDPLKVLYPYLVIRTIASAIGFVMTWLSDSYFGQKKLILIGAVSIILCPLTLIIIAYLATDANTYFSLLESTMFINAPNQMFHGIFEVFILEQVILPQEIDDLSFYIFIVVTIELLAFLAVGVVSIFCPYMGDCSISYQAFALSATVMFLFLFLMHRKKFCYIPSSFRIVELTLAAMFDTLKMKCKKSSSVDDEKMDRKYSLAAYKSAKRITHVIVIIATLASFGFLIVFAKTVSIYQMEVLAANDFNLVTIQYIGIMVLLYIVPMLLLPFFQIIFLRTQVPTQTDLKILGMSQLLQIVAIICTSLIQYHIDSMNINAVSKGYAHMRVFNSLPSPITISVEGLKKKFKVDNFGMLLIEMKGIGIFEKRCTVNSDLIKRKDFIYQFKERSASSLVVRESGMIQMKNFDKYFAADRLNLTQETYGEASKKSICCFIQGLPDELNVQLELRKSSYSILLQSISEEEALFFALPHGEYIMRLYNATDSTFNFTNLFVNIHSRAMYTFLTYFDTKSQSIGIKKYDILDPKNIEPWWIIPQVIIYAAAEIMGRYSFKRFLFTQSPVHLRATMFAYFYFFAETVTFVSLLIKGALLDFRFYGITTIIAIHTIFYFIYLYVTVKYRLAESKSREERSLLSSKSPDPAPQ